MFASAIVGLQSVPADAATAPAVVVARTVAAVTLADAGGTLVAVESLRLGPGAWTVTSDVTAINFGAGDFVRCQLQETGTLIDGGSTVFLADRVAGLTDVGTFTSTGARDISVLCDHDNADATAGQFYIDPGATITAVNEGPIKSPGTTPSAPAVVENRTTKAVPLPDDALGSVLSVHLPAGLWAISANATVVNFGSLDLPYCLLTDPNRNFAVADTGTDGTDAAAAGIDIDTSELVPAGGENLALRCGAGVTGEYVDSGATLTATKTTAPAVVDRAVPQTSLPQSGGTTKVVASWAIPAGAWRVRTDMVVGNVASNGAILAARDFVRCSLRANGTAIDGGATVFMTPDSWIAQLVNAGDYTSTANWTLSLVCSHDQQHTGMGHWAVTGLLQAINKGPIT